MTITHAAEICLKDIFTAQKQNLFNYFFKMVSCIEVVILTNSKNMSENIARITTGEKQGHQLHKVSSTSDTSEYLRYR
jgi:hypothetical protein